MKIIDRINTRVALPAGKRSIFCFLLIVLIAASAYAGEPKVRKHLVNGIRNEYIVVLEDRIASEAVTGVARSITATSGAKLETTWANSLRGFLITAPDEVLPRLAADPRVAYIEQNVRVHFEPPISGTQSTYFDPNCRPDHPDPAHRPPNCTPNYNYLWHLDRLDELTWGQRDGTYNMCPEGRGTVAKARLRHRQKWLRRAEDARITHTDLFTGIENEYRALVRGEARHRDRR